MKKLAKDKILIFGRGQMGNFLTEFLKNTVLSSADITKPAEIEADLKKYQPDVVINTAAKTSIDWCEQNKQEAFEINTLGAQKVWEACQKRVIFLCHFSSGCIFSSQTAGQIFNEDDRPNPGCYYSWTKVWAENLLGKSPNLLVLRPRVVISSKVDRRNTLAKMAVYSHFITDLNTVTVVEDMLPVIGELIARRVSGTFNVANQGLVSPYEIAEMIKAKINPQMSIEKTTLSEVNRNLVAKRVTTVLSTEKLKTVGHELPHIKESLPKVMARFKKNLDKVGGLKSLNQVRQETKQKYSIVQKSASVYEEVN